MIMINNNIIYKCIVHKINLILKMKTFKFNSSSERKYIDFFPSFIDGVQSNKSAWTFNHATVSNETKILHHKNENARNLYQLCKGKFFVLHNTK